MNDKKKEEKTKKKTYYSDVENHDIPYKKYWYEINVGQWFSWSFSIEI